MKQMTLGSLFDGIGGWQIAAVRAGVKPLWSSEIKKFPCAVTARHFPGTLQLGDITKLDGAEIEPVDIICAGSPCQDLSVAGKQEGLKGARSGLFLRAVDIVRDMRRATNGEYPRFFVWENVPGAFSSNRGMDFRAVLEAIGETEIPMPRDGRWANAGLVELPVCQIAWRVLDAQYWGVPQRRKRVFLVADFAERKRRAGEILFERKSLFGHTAKSEGAREGAAAGTESCVDDSSGIAVYDMTHADEVMRRIEDGKCQTLNARMGTGGNQVPVICIEGNGARPSHKGAGWSADGKSYTLNTVDRHAVYSVQRSDEYKKSQISHTLSARDYKSATDLICKRHVRRLTPLECERLQGLPDRYTLIDDKSCSDMARYKALGNGMAQPVADWIIKRIKGAVEND